MPVKRGMIRVKTAQAEEDTASSQCRDVNSFFRLESYTCMTGMGFGVDELKAI